MKETVMYHEQVRSRVEQRFFPEKRVFGRIKEVTRDRSLRVREQALLAAKRGRGLARKR